MQCSERDASVVGVGFWQVDTNLCYRLKRPVCRQNLVVGCSNNIGCYLCFWVGILLHKCFNWSAVYWRETYTIDVVWESLPQNFHWWLDCDVDSAVSRVAVPTIKCTIGRWENLLVYHLLKNIRLEVSAKSKVCSPSSLRPLETNCHAFSGTWLLRSPAMTI